MAEESKPAFAEMKEEKNNSYFRDFTEEERIEYWNMYGDLFKHRMALCEMNQEGFEDYLASQMWTNREMEVIHLKEDAFKELLFKLITPEDIDYLFHMNYGYVKDYMRKVDEDGDIVYPPTEKTPF